MQDGSRRRARLILILGVVLALLAGGGTFLYASQSQTATAPVIPTTPVLVAARDAVAQRGRGRGLIARERPWQHQVEARGTGRPVRGDLQHLSPGHTASF